MFIFTSARHRNKAQMMFKLKMSWIIQIPKSTSHTLFGSTILSFFACDIENLIHVVNFIKGLLNREIWTLFCKKRVWEGKHIKFYWIASSCMYTLYPRMVHRICWKRCFVLDSVWEFKLCRFYDYHKCKNMHAVAEEEHRKEFCRSENLS